MSINFQKAILNLRQRTLKRKPKLSLVKWADDYRFLSKESSSQAGRWKTSTVEVAREPMMAFTDPKVKKISVMGCTQLLKTELLNNIIGYTIHQDPGPILLIQPTIKLAESWMEERFDPIVRDTPVIKELVADKKSRDAGNTKEKKMFQGGYIAAIGANSPTDLASRPIKILLCDEIDKYPKSAGKEGDPIKLASERTDTFWDAKVVHVCSPTISGDSRIEDEYLAGDQRIFHVPCPHCDHEQEMKWKNVSWDKGKPESALYYCEDCGEGWSEYERLLSIKRGHFIAMAPFKGHASFKVNKLSSPWQPMSVLAEKFLDSKDSPQKIKTFINTQLAETYKESGEVPEWENIYRRRESYKTGTCPHDVTVLTMGADVQKDRIEFEVVGWCSQKKRSYSIDYVVLHGDPDKEEIWDKFEEEIYKLYPHEDGHELPIKMVAVDSGYKTQIVYSFVRRFQGNRVIAIKGSDSQDRPISNPKRVDVTLDGKTKRRDSKMWSVGSSVLKEEIYSALKKGPPLNKEESYPVNYFHFPEYSEEYFRQLTAEQFVNVKKKGYDKWEWQKLRDRNEALDCRVYALACFYALRLHKFSDSQWERLKSQEAVNGRKPKHDDTSKKKYRRKRRESSIW
jgi:phage terminase large subunit GpA-like protein